MTWQPFFRQWFILVLVLVSVTSCELERYGASTALPEVECQPGEWNHKGQCVPAGLPPDMPCPPGELLLGDGRCQSAGLPLDMKCQPGELELADGRCQPAGVPPEMCGPGFEPDGKMGCNAILPAEACPFGLMAVPGETECREVAPCGEGKWGDIPVNETTQFVDGAYAGNDSDGTKERPWKTIEKGIWKAKPGAIVAVAAGTYVENLLIGSKSVRLWGICPQKTAIRGTLPLKTTIGIFSDNADGTELHNLGISGVYTAIEVLGTSNVIVDTTWIYDTASYGLRIRDYLTPASVSLKNSLIEGVHGWGIQILGAEALVLDSAVRNPQEWNGLAGGVGVFYNDESKQRATVTIQHSIIEHIPQWAVGAVGSNIRVENVAISKTGDAAITLQGHMNMGANVRSDALITSSTVGHAKSAGIFVHDSDATISGVSIRNTQIADSIGAVGIGIRSDFDRAKANILASYIDRSEDAGILVLSSDATIQATKITHSNSAELYAMKTGITLSDEGKVTNAASDVLIQGSRIENNAGVGIIAYGAKLKMETTLVRDQGHRGLVVQNNPTKGTPASALVKNSLFEHNQDVGVFVAGAHVTLETSVVRSNMPDDQGQDGIGVEVQADFSSTGNEGVDIRGCLIADNHRAGIASYGANLNVDSTVVQTTHPDFAHGYGVGISVSTGSSATIRASRVEANHFTGLSVTGAALSLEKSTILHTRPYGGKNGFGVAIGPDEEGNRASGTIRSSLVEGNVSAGVLVSGADVVIESTAVHRTQPRSNGFGGQGIMIQEDNNGNRSHAQIQGTRVSDNFEIGVGLIGSVVEMKGTRVTGTRSAAADAQFGDGICVFSEKNPTNVVLVDVRVVDSARVGISNFGGEIELRSSAITTCDGLNLSMRNWNDHLSNFHDRGENHCGCPAASGGCQMAIEALEPPQSIADPEPMTPNP